jgi:hypothetical protein
MKLIPALCIFLLLLSVSCKKSNDQPNTPPPVTDTTKPPVVKADTSTLLKSALDYSYDASGMTISDSSLIEWKYDDQRRIVQKVTKAGNLIDSLFYTYSNDGYITDDHAYTSGSLIRSEHAVYYQHVQNRTDSIIVNNESGAYIYYNSLGQDSLERDWLGASGPTQVQILVKYYYTGQTLDSVITWYNGGLSSINYYKMGNLTGSNVYTLDNNHTLEMTYQYTYTNIPVGGLNVYIDQSYLSSGTTVIKTPSGTTSVETNVYQMDEANRVTVWTVNYNQPYSHKYLFIWY